MKPSRLLCEYCENPVGIDQRPVFTWSCECAENDGIAETGRLQTGYRVLVAASPGELAEGRAAWDSGERLSAENCCRYGEGRETAPPLVSSREYWWTVKLRHDEGWSAYGEPARFEMGLLEDACWEGCWIGLPNDSRAVGLFRHDAKIEGTIRKARIYLASDGYAELWLNGARVGENLLEPANTDHGKRVFYNTYDVTGHIRNGDNAVGVMLGQGWSKHSRFLLQGRIWMEDGRVLTLRSGFQDWSFLYGPILSATIYSGEVYNANYEKPLWNQPGEAFYREYERRRWSVFSDYLPVRPEDNEAQYREFSRAYYDVMELPAPEGRLMAQPLAPIRATQVLPPKALIRRPDGGYIFDFGQNFAGVVRVRLRGDRYTRVKIQYSEILNKDQTLNMDYLKVSDPLYPLPMQCDEYILKGTGDEEYQPRFTYHGFRYASVDGVTWDMSAEDMDGIVMHTDVALTGRFECANELVNRIQSNVLWTERSNLYGIPTDCCQRSERQGWLNDMTARAEESVYNFDLNRFYEKFIRDIRDTQDPVSGAIADTAPYRRGNYPADPVASSYLILPDILYDFYGNRRPIEEHYESMRAWTRFLGRIARNDIISFSMYGDWASPVGHCTHNGICSPVSAITPGDFISTGYYYYNLRLMTKFAAMLGRPDEAEDFVRRGRRVLHALNARFRDASTGDYAGGSQGSNVFALFLGIVPEGDEARVAARVALDVINNDYHLTTGNLMTKYLPEVLTDYGYLEVAWKLVVQTTYPSWGYMLSKDATTIWERWEYETGYGMNSHSHPMFGSVSSWFYKYLAGIRPLAPGFARIGIKPYFPAELPRVTCTLDTVRGLVESSWERDDDGLILDVRIPAGAIGEIAVPIGAGTSRIEANGAAIWDGGRRDHPAGTLRYLKDETAPLADGEDRLWLEADGGSYRFRIIGLG